MRGVPDGSLPVPAILQLWSLGHSGGQIASMMGLGPHGTRAVHLVVANARDIGDPRAVDHAGRNGRPLGRPNEGVSAEIVPAVRKLRCKHGHPRTPENVDSYGNCRICRSAANERYRCVTVCKRGHPRIAKNVTKDRHCRICEHLRRVKT